MQKLVFIIFSFFLFSSWITSCSEEYSQEGKQNTEDFNSAVVFIENYLADTAKSHWDTTFNMPDEGSLKLKIDYPGGTLRELFRDSNKWHYAIGEKIGINPILTADDEWPLRRPLEKIRSGKYYMVDELTHSYPFLIPESHELLDELGKRFHDTLQARGGGNYRLKVTSLLRTGNSVAKLRRVNRTSVDSSSHLFGTSFDISYTNFPFEGGEPHRTQEDLKNLLAELLFALREEGKCYIIYERKTGCFHITVRPQEN